MHCGGGGVMGGTGCESCFSIHPHFSATLHGNTGPLSLASTKTLPPAFTTPQVSAAIRELPEQTELRQSVHCLSCQSESRTPGPLSSLGRAEAAFVRTSMNNTAALGYLHAVVPGLPWGFGNWIPTSFTYPK